MDLSQLLRGLTLHLLDTQEFKLEDRRSLDISNEEPAFGFVLKGCLRITSSTDLKRRAAKVNYGEVFLLPSECRCSIQSSYKSAAHFVLLRFQCAGDMQADVPRKLPSFSAVHEPQLHHFRMPRFRNWIQDLLNDSWRIEPPSYLLAQSYLYATAAEFMAYRNKPKPTQDLTDYVLQVKQDILDNFSEPIDIEETARLSGSSPTRFYHEFKQHTGLSPLKFVTMAKLNESLRLLAGGSLSVMEASNAVGYPDPLYFSRLFKKHMGLSPSEYSICTKTRVANLSPVFRGDLSVLGITPVLELSREWYDDPDKDKYFKQIEQSRPDMILMSPVADALYERLSRICPVVRIDWKGYSWKDTLTHISRILQIPTVAERWLAYFDMKLDNARGHIRRQLGNKPFLIVSANEHDENSLRVYGMQRMKMSDLFYGELRMTAPASVQSLQILDVPDLTQAAALDCDNILLIIPSSHPDERCIQLEEEWLGLKRNSRHKQCIFIRFEEPLLYNAAFYDNLIDQFVDYLIRYP